MKKTILSIATVLVAIVMLSACKKGDGGTDPIVASWEGVTFHYSYSVNSVPPVNNTMDTSYAHGKSIVITFNSDNTFKSVDNTTTPATTDMGTYSLLAGKIILKDTASAATPDTANYSITNNVLTIYQTTIQMVSGFTETSSFTETFNKQ